MSGEIAVHALVLVAFASGLRFLALVRPTSDDWGVLTKIANQRASRWITYELGDAIQDGDFPYPMLPHFLISRLPRRWWRRAAVFLNVGSDLAIAGALWLALRFWLPGLVTLGTDATWFATAGAAAFLATPILVPITSRVRATNGRAPGLPLALAGLAFTSMTITDGWIWALPAVLALLATTLTSFFAAQTLVFFALPLAIWTMHAAPLVIVAIGAAIGFAWPALGVRPLVLFKINHWIWYWGNREMVANVGGRNLIRTTLDTPRLLFSHPSEGRALLFRRAPVWILLYSVPALWVVALACLDPEIRALFRSDPQLDFALGCIAASTLLFVLTSIGRLTIFGQAERYFEYTSPFLILLAATAAAAWGPDPDRTLLLLALAGAAIILLSHVLSENANVRRLTRGNDDDRDERELAAFLATLGPIRAATTPIKLPALLSYYTKREKGCEVSFYYRFIAERGRPMDGFQAFEDDTEQLDLFRGTPDELAARYGLGHVIAERAFVEKRAQRSTFAAALSQREPLWSNPSYAVYRVGDDADATDAASA